MSTAPRSSKRKRTKTKRFSPPSGPSDLQNQLDRARYDVEGVVRLVRDADDRDIADLIRSERTPLVDVIEHLGTVVMFCHGDRAEADEKLMRAIRVFHQRGISLNWKGEENGHGYWKRPLVEAAYYGFSSAVRLLVELGALPGLIDSHGRTVWEATFEVLHMPFQECDKCTAQNLLDVGAMTGDLGAWKRAAEGELCYMNDDRANVMGKVLVEGNVAKLKFLLDAGGVLTDHSYLFCVHWPFNSKSQFLAIVKELLLSQHETSDGETEALINQNVESWSPNIDWSFPPTWKVGVRLCRNCGLPEAIFQSHVVPYLGRDWFFPSSRLTKKRMSEALQRSYR